MSVTPAAGVVVLNDRVVPCVGPATTVPFLLMVMNNGAVPPAAVAVMVAVEPGQLVAGGVIVQVGIGVPVRVVVQVVGQLNASLAVAV